ncbi:hypothetical protein [Gordonia sp. ABSL49_1]|uniref:hypothetical protein n=1 Tax=Gordonia sp. ABSL49_1 TaxID=2920941 RepID=UPI001F114218|nr:hypothetical protein [Gordonia sp. ABSL49_1]MCH5642436.1 hypothetical protein [Gordonia sp. ABSL49_1]
MMTLVRLIDIFVEFVKILIGQSGNAVARVLAWLVVLAAVVAVVWLIAWGVSMIPTWVDALNGS